MSCTYPHIHSLSDSFPRRLSGTIDEISPQLEVGPINFHTMVYTHYILYTVVYICQSQLMCPSPNISPLVTISLVSKIFKSVFANDVLVYPFFIRVHIWVISCDVCLSLSDLLPLVWSSLGPPGWLQMACFHYFLWVSNIPPCICTTSPQWNITQPLKRKKKQRNPVIWNDMERLGGSYAQWHKSDGERQTYMRNLKTQANSYIQRTLWSPEVGGMEWGVTRLQNK